MKIVHIITRLIIGGAQENTLITCREQAKRGHEVVLITGPAIGPEGGLFCETENQAFKTIVIDKLVREIKPDWDLIAYSQIKKILKEIKPDVVHTHSAKAGILGRIAGYSLKDKTTKKPTVVHTIHGLAFHEYQNSLLNKLYIAIEKYTAKKTDEFICVADTMTEKAVAAGLANPSIFTTAYSAIDEEDFLRIPSMDEISKFRSKYSIDSEAKVIVTVARLAELKGHEFIIESAKSLSVKHPKAVWLFVGNGHLTDQLKTQIISQGLKDKFRFTGLLNPKQIPLAIHASEILVHCSLREGLARVLPQAMLCGKAVISFDIDGAKEVVNSNTGRLLEPENIDQLIAASDELLSNPGLCKELGLNGRDMVKKQFAPETMVETIQSVYEKHL